MADVLHTRWGRLSALAASQHGVVGRRQLELIGLTRRAIDHAVGTGRLHRLHRAVYAVGHPAVTWPGQALAAVLAAGPGAVLSHVSAAGLWRLMPEPPAPFDVTVPSSGRAAREGLRIHRTRRPPAATTRHGIPVTVPAATLLDLADVLPERPLERAWEEAQVRSLVTPGALRRALAEAAGRRGAPRLTAMLDRETATVTRSELEERGLALIRAAGLPAPELNRRVAGFEVDMLWREQGVVVELDGFGYHRSRSAFERDRARDARLQAAGLQVVRLTHRRVTEAPLEAAATLGALLL